MKHITAGRLGGEFRSLDWCGDVLGRLCPEYGIRQLLLRHKYLIKTVLSFAKLVVATVYDWHTIHEKVAELPCNCESTMPKSRKGPKALEKGLTADDFDKMAAELRSFADKLSDHAEDMRELEIPELYPLMGNYTAAIESLRNWFKKQFMPKLFEAVSASNALVEIKVISEKLLKDSPKQKPNENG